MFLFSSSGFFILALNLYSILDSSLCQSGPDVSQWMCVDENCSEPIAEAVVIKPYTPDDSRKIHVRKGDKLKILGRIPKGTNHKLVYVESLPTKKRGLLSANYFQERKILVKHEELIRTNLLLPGDEPPTPDIKPSDINPSAPSTVIDGTTIDAYDYPTPYASYEPTQTPGSSSESVVQSTTPPSIPASDPERIAPKDNEVGSDLASESPEVTPIADISLGEKSNQASVPPGNGNPPDREDLGISSTPASIIANAKQSSAPEVPTEADIVVSTTSVPSPLQEPEIGRSQEVSDSPVQPDPEEPPTAEGTQEGSGTTPDEAEASGVWGGFSSIFSFPGSGEVEDDFTETSIDSSASGEVIDDHAEISADSSPSEVPSLRRGPNPGIEGEASEGEKLAEESPETVELKPSNNVDPENTDVKSKRSVSDSSEFPGDNKASEPVDGKENPVEPAKPDQNSTDGGNPEQGYTDSTPAGQDPGLSAPLIPGLGDRLTEVGSLDNVEPNTGSIPVKQVSEKTVDPAGSTVAAEKDTENSLDKSTEPNPNGEDPVGKSTDANPNSEDSVGKEVATKEGSESDIPQEHTQETRVSMSSSQKTDISSQDVRIKHGDPSQQGESTEVTVETDESSTEDTNNTAVYDQGPASSDSVQQPSELHNISSDGITIPPAEPQPSSAGALKSDHLERKVLKTEDSGAEGAGASVDVAKADQQSVVSLSVDSSVQHVSTPERPTSIEGPVDVPQAEKPFGLSDLNFASPMEFVDPRKTNPDLRASDPPSAEKPMEPQNQWTASVEEVPLYNQWASTPEPPVRLADPVPTSQPSWADQSAASDASSDSNLASGVGPAPSDQQPTTPPSFQEPDLSEDFSEPWYNGIFSVFGSLQDMLSGSAPESDEQPVHQADSLVTPKTVQADEQSQTCQTDSCGAGEKTFDVGSSVLEYYDTLPTKTVILMVVTAGAVLIFSLGYYFLENQQRDVELVSKYNELVGKLFIEQKEKETLLEQLASANESMTQISFDTTKFDEEIRDLKALVQKYKEEKAAIEEKEKEANRRRIISDKNYNDLLKTLSMHKQKGERSALSAEVKNLKDRIEADEINIASLKEQLLEKKDEIKSLNAKILDLGETNQQLERNVEKSISQVHDNAQKYQESISKLEKTIEENTAGLVKLEAECTKLKKEKESLAIEKELAESSLQKFQQLTPSNALTDWLDAKEVRVSLLAAEKKIAVLSEANEALFREKKQLEEKWKSLKLDLDQLNESYEKAEREKIDALTKLQVLSDYFKEKETQLQEELGSKEALWLQKQSDDRSIYEQMRALREENTSFKNQNETLKREILEQEASYKKLIASANEKADEHWVALRHTERRLKEAQMESSQLRSRLSTLGATSDNPADKIKGEVNGDLPPYGSATSPQFMLYPHEFVPPPPLPTTTPSRPPPLGRISSPPPVDFVPPPPIIPFESLFLPPSPPPPVPHAMMNITHKPQPLDGAHHRTQKDSQSSNHSSESTSDKPRRNKR